MHLDLTNNDSKHHCTCIWNGWPSRRRADENNPCRYHTTIDLLLEVGHIRRIRKLEVHLVMFNRARHLDQDFEDALDSKFFASPLPAIETLNFHIDQRERNTDTLLKFPRDLFCWGILPPTKLRHLALRGCYNCSIRAVRNLTSLELAGARNAPHMNQHDFLPFISSNPSLVSLRLSHCTFLDHKQLSRVAPVTLPKLKSLQLMDVYGLPGFPGLIDVPSLRTLSSLLISNLVDIIAYTYSEEFLVRAESDDGFQLSCNSICNDKVVPG